ncbi:U4/U6 small nuclear ribonucleoprotein Prp3 [Wickerhamiella sorbophila]|uniref:U4/U6 small nuclear ribonucleoprotein Prp3 n=1 Tax=Wickerhamiella sorbophila TaxID=45607 RepID=A0A2T0FN45_9ASCO|nr:U4/U6 small nuclear ribonucleoprotein Prp3 [Wickerhamiella sorbophila]PRT56397.1 U4/U6 small nuclear ribonucleoprotein Prp3 [Wickerhamiella sorbophila]
MGLDTAQLLANIRKRKAELSQDRPEHKRKPLDTQGHAAVSEEPQKPLAQELSKANPYLSEAGPSRQFKPLIFNPQGKHIKIAEQLRKQEEIERIKATCSSTGYIPQLPPSREWWDDGATVEITDEIFCPVPIDAPSERLYAGEGKIYMTQRELKRMRKHTRYEQRREVQDRIRLGLDPPPPPKISQKNIVAVIGAEYYSDPTKFDKMAARQLAEREKAHQETNAARKLDGDARWEKHVAKVERDKAKGLSCAVLKFNGVVSGERRYILDQGAQKLLLTGVLLCTQPFSLVVVEGGALEVKKFKKLAAKTKERDDAGEAQLIWQGELRAAKFKRWSIHALDSKKSRDLLEGKHALSFWNLAENL